MEGDSRSPSEEEVEVGVVGGGGSGTLSPKVAVEVALGRA